MSNDEKEIILFRLNQILESISLIREWSKHINCPNDFLISMERVMAFNACVMRLQVIGEQVGKLLKLKPCPLEKYTNIPWVAIYDMRNIISHEYSYVDESVIFSTIKNDLTGLETVILDIINDLNKT